jgi:hypothetical protein
MHFSYLILLPVRHTLWLQYPYFPAAGGCSC